MSCLFYLPIMSIYFCARRDLPASSTVARIPNSLQPCCTFRLERLSSLCFNCYRALIRSSGPTIPPPPTPPPSSSWSVSPGSGHISLVWTRRKLESWTLHFYCTQSLNERGHLILQTVASLEYQDALGLLTCLKILSRSHKQLIRSLKPHLRGTKCKALNKAAACDEGARP